MCFETNCLVFVFQWVHRSPPLSSTAVFLVGSCPSVRPTAPIFCFLKCIIVDSCETHSLGFTGHTEGCDLKWMPCLLSVMLVPEGAEDYVLIPLDFGPCSRREALRQGSRLKVILQCLQNEQCSSFVMGCSLRCCSHI